MNFQIGDIIGDYKILGVVGSGGMGRVFKAEHTITRRLEAVKVLLRDQGAEPELARRFLREIQLQASLDHPHIASVYNAFSAGSGLVMVMELVEGDSLERLLKRGRIPWPAAVNYACQALSALAYAHAHGITHRDVKRANIIITPDGVMKLTDFGLARARAENIHLTQSGLALGSLYYMSPEQVKGVATVDGRTDIYSLGVVLYEMVTGFRPFNSESEFDVMRAHVEQAPAPPLERQPGLPRALNDVILTALAKKPEERFASAGDFHHALGPLKDASSARCEAGRFGWLSGRASSLPGRSRALQFAAAFVALFIPAIFLNVSRRAGSGASGSAAADTSMGAQKSTVAGAEDQQKPAPRVMTLARGTTLKIRTKQTLSTNTNHSGETFFAALQEPLTAGAWVVAPKGAIIEGRIEEADSGGRFKGRACLTLRLTRLYTREGGVIQISTDSVMRHGTGRLAFLKRGGPAVLPAETPVVFHVLASVTIPV